MAIGEHMWIYADVIYEFSIASKGAYAIYFVFYMTLCWISTRHTKIVAGRLCHSVSFLNENLQVKRRSCHLVSFFNRNLRLTLRSRHFTSFFRQKSDFCTIEGEEGWATCSCHVLFSHHIRQPMWACTWAKCENSRLTTYTALVPFSPSLMGLPAVQFYCILPRKSILQGALSDEELWVSWELKAMYHNLPHNTALKESSPIVRMAEDLIADFFILWVVQGVGLVLEWAVCELMDCIGDLSMWSTWIGHLWGRGNVLNRMPLWRSNQAVLQRLPSKGVLKDWSTATRFSSVITHDVWLSEGCWLVITYSCSPLWLNNLACNKLAFSRGKLAPAKMSEVWSCHRISTLVWFWMKWDMKVLMHGWFLSLTLWTMSLRVLQTLSHFKASSEHSDSWSKEEKPKWEQSWSSRARL